MKKKLTVAGSDAGRYDGSLWGFTTLSAFSLQSLMHFHDGAWRIGIVCVAASVLFCPIAVWAGYAMATAICAMPNRCCDGLLRRTVKS
jgi:fluoride ion exporter CrcB/FEX